MPTIADLLLKGMKETKPGIKGTESESLADLVLSRKEKRQKQEKPWYSFLSGSLPQAGPFGLAASAGIRVGQTLGGLLFGKKKEKPLIASSEEIGLGARGYSQEDIDRSIGGEIRVDMRKVLDQRGTKLSSEEMGNILSEMGYSEDEIRKAGVKI